MLFAWHQLVVKPISKRRQNTGFYWQANPKICRANVIILPIE